MISRKLTADPFRKDTTGQTSRVENLYQKVAISILVFVPLAATIYAIYAAWGSLVDWLDLTLLLVMYVLVGLGVTIGFHRYLAHGSFKTHTPLKLLLVILGTMSWQGGPISWVAIHRKHHAYSDQEGDIHSPQLSSNLLKGFVHAQVGWMFGTKRPDNNKWARDLVNDRTMVFIHRTSLIWCALSLVIPYLIGGWSALLWAGLVRVFLTHHVTWSVNSVCHVFGGRPFNTNDRSTNHWLVGLLGFGEGGHNTHHASPRSAQHGLRWWHFDASWLLINLMRKLRLAYDVYVLHPLDLKEALRTRAGKVKVVCSATRSAPLDPASPPQGT